MDTELLPPEEEQKQEDVSPQELQRQFDMPSPRRNAGLDAPSRTTQAAGFLKKNKKWFIGGATGLGILIPIFLFFFWLMLFKNVHIKNLYVTYRWAQFNRGINKALKGQLEEAKADGVAPEGAADTVIPEDAAPKEIIKEANAEDVGPDKLNPADDAQVADEAARARATQQSVEGPTQEVFNDVGVERSVKSDAPDAPDQTATEKAAKNVESEIEGKGEGAKDAPGSLKDAVKEALDNEAKGDSPKEAASKAADGVINGSTKFAQAVRSVQGVLVIATFYCIFRDVYVSGKEQINKILVGGATGVSQELNKTADCQKLGACSLDQAGAVANKYDNSDSSFTESCGYARATQSNNNCTEIPSSYTVADIYDKVGGAGGKAIRIGDAVLDPPGFSVFKTKVSLGADSACKLILDMKFQAVLATVGLVGVVVTAPEGEEWAAAGQVVKTGLVTAAATTGGKALIMHTILAYTGGLFKDLSPIDMGNITDMGNLATASGACKAAGCVKATPQEAQALNMEYRQERIAANKRRSTLAKLFDTNSTDSVITRVALNTPTTPSAMMGRIGTLFASLSNPLKLNLSLGHTTMALGGGTAMAVDSLKDNPYNIAEYVPANVLKGYSSKELNAFYNNLDSASKDSLKSQFEKCNKGNTVDALSSQDRTGCDDDRYMKYASYMFEQGTVLAWAKSHNNQSSSTISSTAGGGSNTAGPVFMLGDSITEGLDIVGISKMFEDKSYSPVNIDASRSREFTTKGKDNAKTSAFEALDDPTNIDNIKKSPYVFVGLGTNPLGNINTTTYGDQISQTIDKIKAINPNVSIYWLNVISPAISQAAARNNTLNQQAAAKNFTVIDATSLKLNYVDKVHPDVPSYKTLASFIVSKMTEGSVPSGDAKSLAQQLLDSPQVSFTTTQAEDALKAIASGGKARVPCLRNDGGGTYISSSLLSALVKVTGKYSIGIGFLTNGCHSDNSAHYSGRAVDINQVNGQRVTGSEKISWDFLTELSNFLPDGSGYGQAGCGVSDSTVRLAHKINIFDDTCNHIHVQVPK